MKNTSHSEYYDLIQKAKKNNPYLYVAIYNEAKRNLIPKQFTLLQQKMTSAA